MAPQIDGLNKNHIQQWGEKLFVTETVFVPERNCFYPQHVSFS